LKTFLICPRLNSRSFNFCLAGAHLVIWSMKCTPWWDSKQKKEKWCWSKETRLKDYLNCTLIAKDWSRSSST
jgi:hypothetical protein